MNGNNAIWYSQGIDNAGLRQGHREAQSIWNQMEKSAVDAGIGIGKIWQNVGTTIGTALSIEGLRRFASEAVKVRGEFQQLEIAFTTMLKSAEKSQRLMGELSGFAATTPFGLQSAASGAKQLIAYGSAAETVIDELRMLGDVASGTGQSINDLVYLYGTLRVQGRAMTMDIRQFAGRGIPIYEELAKVLGVAKDQVSELVTAGKVGFAEVEQAFKNMTSSGGMYGGLMEAQSKSIGGRMEQLGDAVDMMFNKIGKSSEGVIYKAIDGASSLVENYDQVGKIVLELVAIYGSYRAALMVINVVKAQQAAINSQVIRQMVIERALRPGATMDMIREAAVTKTLAIAKQNLVGSLKSVAKSLIPNPYVLAAAAVAGLAFGIYKLITYQTDAEKATKKLNKAIEDGKSARDSELYQLEIMKARLDAAKEGTEEYAAAKKAILDKWGSHLLAMTEEQKKLLTTTELYNKLTEAITNAANARAIDAVQKESGDLVTEKYSETFDEVEKMLIKKFGEKTAAGYMVQLTPVLRGTEQITPELDKIINQFDKFRGGMVDESGVTIRQASTTNALREEIQSLQAVRVAANKEVQRAIGKFGPQQNDPLKDGFDTTKASIDELAKALPAAEEKLKSLVKAGDNQEAIKNQQLLVDSINEQIKARLAAGQVSKGYYESEKSRLEGLLSGMDEVTRKSAEGARIQAELDKVNAKLQIWNPKSGGSAPKSDDTAALWRKYEDDIAQARVDAMAEGLEKVLAQNALNYQREKSQIEEEYKNLGADAVAARVKMAEDAKKAADAKAYDDEFAFDWDAEMAAFNDYLIEYGSYQEKRLGITQKYEKLIADAKTAGEKMSLGKQMTEELAAVDSAFSKTKTPIEVLFEDMKKKSVDEMRQIAAQAEEMMEFVLSGEWDEGKAKGFGIATKEIFEQLNTEWGKSPEELEIIRKAIEELIGTANATEKPLKKISDGLKKVFSTKLSQTELETELGNISDGLNSVIELTDLFAGSLQNIGELSGNETFTNIANGLSQVADVASSTMKGAQAGAAFGPAGAIVGGALGLVSSITGIFAENKKHREELKKQIRDNAQEAYFGELEVNQLYRERYEWAKKIGEAQLEYIQRNGEELKKQAEENADDQSELWAGLMKQQYKSGEHFEKTGWFGWGKGKIVTEWASLAGKTWEDIEMLAAQGKLSEEGMKYYEALKAAKEEGEDLVARQEEFLEEVRESFTGTTSESIVDSIVDGFRAGKRAAADFADTFEELMQGAVASALKMAADTRIRDFYEQFANMANDSDGLTEADIAYLNDLWNRIITATAQEAENLENVTGMTFGEAGDTRTSASQGFAQASQDSIDSLFGVVTNIGNHTYGIAEMMKIQQANTDVALGHLAAISQNTHELYAMREDLGAMRGDIGAMRGDLNSTRRTVDDIRLKGVKMV